MEDGWIGDIVNNQHQQAGNSIGAEGANALSEALKANTSLQSLNMEGEQESVKDGRISDIANKHKQAGNEIRDEGDKSTERGIESQHITFFSLVSWKRHSEQAKNTPIFSKFIVIFFLIAEYFLEVKKPSFSFPLSRVHLRISWHGGACT